jgi:hypothetical protein
MSSSVNSIGSSSIGSAASPARHLQVHADLEEPERRKLPDRFGAGPVRDHVERALQPELRAGLDGDREPEVEIVIAQVVVRHAGVRVDELRRTVRVGRVDLRGDEHRRVAERAGVEDRRDLADDPLVEQARDAGQNLRLGQPRALGDQGERAPIEREAALHQIEQLLVGLVERYRGATRARAHLRPGYLSHPATSFAW